MRWYFILEIPTPLHACRLSVVDDSRLKEIGFVSVRILESLQMLVWIFGREWVERLESEHRESRVCEPLCILSRRLMVDPWDAISEYVLTPDDLLSHCLRHHLSYHCLTIDLWVFTLYLTDDMRKKRHMCELITTYIRDHTTSRLHTAAICECIKEGKAIVKIERLQEKVGDNRTKKMLIAWILPKLLIDRSYVFVALEEDLIISPKIIDRLTILTLYDALKYRGIRL